MNEKPVLFSGEMVRAILDGHKTQTRRVVKPALLTNADICSVDGPLSIEGEYGDHHEFKSFCPYGRPGDRLWVRETWGVYRLESYSGQLEYPNILYRSDNSTRLVISQKVWDIYKEGKLKWRPSIFLPRWASRILLDVVNVRVERLQDISEEDAKAEGFQQETIGVGYQDEPVTLPAKQKFGYLWDKINADRGYSFDSNPWVWVVEFRRVEQ